MVRRHPKSKEKTSKTKPKHQLVPRLSKRRSNAAQHLNSTRLEHHTKPILGNSNPNLEIRIRQNKSPRFNRRNKQTIRQKNNRPPQRHTRQNQIRNRRRRIHTYPRSFRLLVRIRSNAIRTVPLPIRKQRILRQKFPSTIRHRIHRTNTCLVLLHDVAIRNPIQQDPFRKRPNNRNNPSRRRTKNVKIIKQLPRPTRSRRQIRSRFIKILHPIVTICNSR